jgi:NADPH:quinone reductase-like Zn-dependent oxidoreductase
MKAAQITGYGGPEVFTISVNAARPVPAEGQVLVRVAAASLNPVDSVMRAGHMQQMIPLTLPATIGGDFAGMVEEAAPGSGFSVGDEVYGQANPLLGGTGSLAEFAAARAGFTARRPRTVDFAAAASLPLVGASAEQAIVEHLKVRPGQRILIHGAAGGVGMIAVQIAKHRGAFVIATAFTSDLEFVKSLGADEVIDARIRKFEEQVREIDGVLDTTRGDTAARSYRVLKRGGVLVSLTAQPDESRMKETGVTAIGQLTQPTTDRLTRLAALVDQGAVTPLVDRVFPLDQTAAAFSYNDAGNPRGKVIIRVGA